MFVKPVLWQPAEVHLWKFCFKRLTRLRVDPMPHDYPPIRTDLLAADPDWLMWKARG